MLQPQDAAAIGHRPHHGKKMTTIQLKRQYATESNSSSSSKTKQRGPQSAFEVVTQSAVQVPAKVQRDLSNVPLRGRPCLDASFVLACEAVPVCVAKDRLILDLASPTEWQCVPYGPWRPLLDP